MIELNRRTAEAVTALALLALVILLFIHSFSLPPSPMRGYPGAAFMPRLILIYSAIFLLLWLARLVIWHKPTDSDAGLDPEADPAFDFEYRDYLITIVAVLAFVFGLEHIGFEITCFTVFAALLYPRLSSLALVLLVSLLSTLFLYVTFVLLLNVTMPLAFLPNYITF